MRARWCILLLMILPIAQAGTADDPEITDSASDAGGRPGMDIAAAWITEEPGEEPSLRFTFKLAGDPQHLPAFFAAHEEFRLNFVSESMPEGIAEIYVSLRPTCSQVTAVTNVPTCQEDLASCRAGFAAAAGGYQALEAETAITGFMDSGDQMGCVATYAQLGLAPGASVLEPYVTHRLVARGPLSSGDQVGPTVLEAFDRAPDTGFGRAFASAPADQVPAIVYLNATTFPISLAQEHMEPFAGTQQLNWTSPGGNASIGFTVNATNGTLRLTMSVGNETVFAANGTQNATVELPAGNGTIVLEYQGFVGRLLLEAAAQVAAVPGVPGADGTVTGAATGDATGNATGAEPLDDAKDVPLPVLVPLAGVALALVRRRF